MGCVCRTVARFPITLLHTQHTAIVTSSERRKTRPSLLLLPFFLFLISFFPSFFFSFYFLYINAFISVVFFFFLCLLFIRYNIFLPAHLIYAAAPQPNPTPHFFFFLYIQTKTRRRGERNRKKKKKKRSGFTRTTDPLRRLNEPNRRISLPVLCVCICVDVVLLLRSCITHKTNNNKIMGNNVHT